MLLPRFRYALGVAIFVVITCASHNTNAQTVTPSKIIIPSISVNTKLIGVGVTTSGNLDVPHNYTQAGWYNLGILPGQIGNAVIDGHVDNGAAISGPFKNLKKTKIGDEISVLMSDGTKEIFKIIDLSVFPTKAFPGRSVFIGNKLDSVLKIITCHGNFVKKDGTYDHRLIVTAVKVNPVVATK